MYEDQLTAEAALRDTIDELRAEVKQKDATLNAVRADMRDFAVQVWGDSKTLEVVKGITAHITLIIDAPQEDTE